MTLWQAWDEHSAEWITWARRGDDGFWRQTWPQLAALLPPDPGLVVDVGCGEGRAARELQQLGHRVVGVERSLLLASAAHEHPEPVVVMQGPPLGPLYEIGAPRPPSPVCPCSTSMTSAPR